MFAQTPETTGLVLTPWAADPLGCLTLESGSVAFFPSFLPLVSAGEAPGQCTEQGPELCLQHANPWHSFLLPSEHLPPPCSYGNSLSS